MKVRVTKVKIFAKFASEQASAVWMKAMSALNPSKFLGEIPKVRWKQTKYSKYLRLFKERISRWNHCAWSLLKVTRTCPIWQPEKIVEKLNGSSCLVKFCWFGITAQAGRVAFMQLGRRALNPSFWWTVWYILPSFNGHFLNIWQPKHGNRSAV